MLGQPFENRSEYWLRAFGGNLSGIVFLAPLSWGQKAIRKHELMMWVCREPKDCWVWDELSQLHLCTGPLHLGWTTLWYRSTIVRTTAFTRKILGELRKAKPVRIGGGSSSGEPSAGGPHGCLGTINDTWGYLKHLYKTQTWAGPMGDPCPSELVAGCWEVS